MNEQVVIRNIEAYIKELFTNDITGHDYFHMKRVAHLAKYLAKIEQADLFVTEAAAWLHDVGDHKLFSNAEQVVQDMVEKLKEWGLPEHTIASIMNVIKHVSYSKGHSVPESIEGKVVQDADRLDAIGAIGIARTFAYGGANNQLIYTGKKRGEDQTTIQHFYDKLLLLKQLMNTNTAKKIAKQRHRFMEHYLQQFYDDWEGTYKLRLDPSDD